MAEDRNPLPWIFAQCGAQAEKDVNIHCGDKEARDHVSHDSTSEVL